MLDARLGRGGPKELGQTHLLSMGPRPPPGQQPGAQTPQSFPSLPQGLPRAPAFSPATSRPFRLGRPVPRALTLIPTPLCSCGLQPDRCSWLSLAWPCPMDSCGCGSCPPTTTRPPRCRFLHLRHGSTRPCPAPAPSHLHLHTSKNKVAFPSPPRAGGLGAQSPCVLQGLEARGGQRLPGRECGQQDRGQDVVLTVVRPGQAPERWGALHPRFTGWEVQRAGWGLWEVGVPLCGPRLTCAARGTCTPLHHGGSRPRKRQTRVGRLLGGQRASGQCPCKGGAGAWCLRGRATQGVQGEGRSPEWQPSPQGGAAPGASWLLHRHPSHGQDQVPRPWPPQEGHGAASTAGTGTGLGTRPQLHPGLLGIQVVGVGVAAQEAAEGTQLCPQDGPQARPFE